MGELMTSEFAVFVGLALGATVHFMCIWYITRTGTWLGPWK